MTATLLLADDSVTIQRVIELTFADEDVKVVAFSDGDAAIARLEQETPDIVLADVGMPGKSGYEVARHIRQRPHLAHIPVLLLTGAFEPIDREKAREVGCDGVLVKPFEPQVVISRVKELLARPRDGTATAAAFDQPAAGAPGTAAEAPAAGETPATAPSAGEFFDRLDAAFATLPRTRLDAPASVADSPPTGPPAQTKPALSEAFAVLLAAEQRGDGSADLAKWAPPMPIVSDELVERVAQSVLGRLSDEVVRQAIADLASTTADLVSTTAERLIREEIERIKASIK